MANDDQHINRGVRSVLARHWVDLTKLVFASRRGIVRITGELDRLGPARVSPITASHLEAMDSELRRVPGVQRVHFDVSNWHKSDDGEWTAVGEQSQHSSSDSHEGQSAPASQPSSGASAGSPRPAVDS